MTRPRTAFLILVHRQPRHLAKLVRALDAPEFAFFIHVDAKTDDAIFRAHLAARPSAVFLAPRYAANWGGFSLVEATLALLHEAYQSPARFDRFCLLSGADFPIKSREQIVAAFDSDTEFLRVDRRLGPHEDNPQSRYVNYYWSMDSTDPAELARSRQIPRPAFDSFSLFHGSQWWALTRGCVDYVLRYVSEHPEYASFFRHARCADEAFFHSIVKQSPYAAHISHDFETTTDIDAYFRSNDHGCHYIDWRAAGEMLPKALDLDDYDALLASSALFARKFDEERSRELLARLGVTLAGTRVLS